MHTSGSGGNFSRSQFVGGNLLALLQLLQLLMKLHDRSDMVRMKRHGSGTARQWISRTSSNWKNHSFDQRNWNIINSYIYVFNYYRLLALSSWPNVTPCTDNLLTKNVGGSIVRASPISKVSPIHLHLLLVTVYELFRSLVLFRTGTATAAVKLVVLML